MYGAIFNDGFVADLPQIADFYSAAA